MLCNFWCCCKVWMSIINYFLIFEFTKSYISKNARVLFFTFNNYQKISTTLFLIFTFFNDSFISHGFSTTHFQKTQKIGAIRVYLIKAQIILKTTCVSERFFFSFLQTCKKYVLCTDRENVCKWMCVCTSKRDDQTIRLYKTFIFLKLLIFRVIYQILC